MAEVKPKSPLLLPILAVCALVLILTLQFGFIFIVIALLPAFVAYFIDETEDKSLFRVILLCNTAGMLPYVIEIAQAAIDMKRYDVIELASNPVVWLVIYCSAAAGWCLVFLCRYAGRFLTVLYFEYQISSLERFRKNLLIEWGERIIEKETKGD